MEPWEEYAMRKVTQVQNFILRHRATLLPVMQCASLLVLQAVEVAVNGFYGPWTLFGMIPRALATYLFCMQLPEWILCASLPSMAMLWHTVLAFVIMAHSVYQNYMYLISTPDTVPLHLASRCFAIQSASMLAYTANALLRDTWQRYEGDNNGARLRGPGVIKGVMGQRERWFFGLRCGEWVCCILPLLTPVLIMLQPLQPPTWVLQQMINFSGVIMFLETFFFFFWRVKPRGLRSILPADRHRTVTFPALLLTLPWLLARTGVVPLQLLPNMYTHNSYPASVYALIYFVCGHYLAVEEVKIRDGLFKRLVEGELENDSEISLETNELRRLGYNATAAVIGLLLVMFGNPSYCVEQFFSVYIQQECITTLASFPLMFVDLLVYARFQELHEEALLTTESLRQALFIALMTSGCVTLIHCCRNSAATVVLGFVTFIQCCLKVKNILTKIYAWKMSWRLVNRLPNATPQEMVDNDDVCAMCLLGLSSARRLPCKHLFHARCIRDWMKVSKRCPMCNRVMLGNIESQR